MDCQDVGSAEKPIVVDDDDTEEASSAYTPPTRTASTAKGLAEQSNESSAGPPGHSRAGVSASAMQRSTSNALRHPPRTFHSRSKVNQQSRLRKSDSEQKTRHPFHNSQHDDDDDEEESGDIPDKIATIGTDPGPEEFVNVGEFR